MTRREPSDEAILAARLQRAYPSLSPYSSASLAQQLCAIERMQRRHAERCCSGEDGGYAKCKPTCSAAGIDRHDLEHDPIAERRAAKRIDREIGRWCRRVLDLQGGLLAPVASPGYELHGDPRGAVLKVRLPGEAEAVSV